MMQLNDMSPSEGAKKSKRRLGRGIGSRGKTCGRGHKGQKSRGCLGKLGFEGGQMPIQRRVPKFGFSSKVGLITANLPLESLNKISEADQSSIDLGVLKRFNLVKQSTKYVKIYLKGKLKNKINTVGISVTKGVNDAILTLGGKVE
jgi:large subunit ribosomal protein L15